MGSDLLELISVDEAFPQKFRTCASELLKSYPEVASLECSNGDEWWGLARAYAETFSRTRTFLLEVYSSEGTESRHRVAIEYLLRNF